MKTFDRWLGLLAIFCVHVVGGEEPISPGVGVSHDGSIYEPTWVYKCIPDEGCQRTDPPHRPLVTRAATNVTAHHIFNSLDVCRTVCGRFGGLWPRPLTAAITTQTVKIHPSRLRFDLVDVPAPVRVLLANMSHLATSNILAECSGKASVVDTSVLVYISVRSSDLSLNWDTDEQYMLDVQMRDGKVVVRIDAETVYGARHGLESLTQLVAPEISHDFECSLRIVTGAKIKDRPVYKHRGFLLDTSRNFIPMDDIKRMIDGMAATKMNVFHWHVTDSHSFPLETPRVPQLTRYGAYSPLEIYTAEEVGELMAFAQIRGVRVLLELDAPAHAGNGWQWGQEYGLGDLAVCVNAANWRRYCIQPPCGQLNPANPNMYKVLRDVYRDIVTMLPKDALFHMGGDEVFFNCWNSTQEIVSYMVAKGFETNVEGYMKLWAEFHQRALRLWDEEQKNAGTHSPQPVMIWSSELTQPHRIQKYLDKNRYVIEVWEPVDSNLLTQLMGLGYRTVSVPKDIWYLDHGFWGTTKYSNWRRMYSHMLPTDKSVLGGEVAMWSEYVDSGPLDARVWPRTAAVAERLWSDPTTSANAAEPRMQRLRNRFLARGIRPDAISPEWCAHHDSLCL